MGTHSQYLDLAREGKLAELTAVTALNPEFAFAPCVEQYNYTALMRAACRGHEDIVTFLLAHGAADTIDSQNTSNYTALHWACACQQESCAKLLLSHGARTDLIGFVVRNNFSIFLIPVILLLYV